ncbi:hypothetical protein CRG98_004224 [Punica granatum]|uniref:Uncharacterized protein n=1 Tax=Punica granatum TaxID=22663 RepID=A0A2I0L3V2_PUNGR|nr:hypothetical protein CRG98_004224 [Punica granatum]
MVVHGGSALGSGPPLHEGGSGRVVAGKPGGFPTVLAGFGLGTGEGLERPAIGQAAADCGRAVASRVEPWLGVESWLGGLAWLSYGSHSIKRKAGKNSRLD